MLSDGDRSLVVYALQKLGMELYPGKSWVELTDNEFHLVKLEYSSRLQKHYGKIQDELRRLSRNDG